MSTEFTPASNTVNQINPINPIFEPTRLWHEEEGVIHFSVTSDGTTGEGWIRCLEDGGFNIGYAARQVLRSPNFKPTFGVKTEVGVLKGILFEDNDRTTKNVRAEAKTRTLLTPNAELACLIRKNFSDEDIKKMGLSCIAVMHEPIAATNSLPPRTLLFAGCARLFCWSQPRRPPRGSSI